MSRKPPAPDSLKAAKSTLTRSTQKNLPRQHLHLWMRGALIVTLGVILSTAFGGRRLSAQVTSGTILGSVQDSTGAAIPGATVTATAEAVGITRTVKTTGNGTFSIPNLDAATYTIAVAAKGFESRTKTGVVLSSADKLSAGVFKLAIGRRLRR